MLADTVGIRAPFTFTGAAAALAALYGLVRLPETSHSRQQQGQDSAAADADSSAVVRNNAVPAALASSSIKLQVPEEAVVCGRAFKQHSQQQDFEARRAGHATVRPHYSFFHLQKSHNAFYLAIAKTRSQLLVGKPYLL